jgi:hypothetical protein
MPRRDVTEPPRVSCALRLQSPVQLLSLPDPVDHEVDGRNGKPQHPRNPTRRVPPDRQHPPRLSDEPEPQLLEPPSTHRIKVYRQHVWAFRGRAQRRCQAEFLGRASRGPGQRPSPPAQPRSGAALLPRRRSDTTAPLTRERVDE